MEDTYLCPDCHTEHTQPIEAVLGHLARCIGCVLLLDMLTDEQMLYPATFEIRIAA